MALDAVISIGGQSFIDGVMRLLGPALQALRTPMPIAVPGLTNSLLTIKNIRPVLPGANRGQIELNVEVEITGEVLLVASVAAGTLNLSLVNAAINLDAATGSVTQRTGQDGSLGIPSLSATGTWRLPAQGLPLDLNPMTGRISLPAVGNLALPLPAVVSVPVDLTRNASLTTTVFLALGVNGVALNTEATIDDTTGFGLLFGCRPANVLPPVSAALAQGIESALTPAVPSVINQLLRGLPPGVLTGITQPLRDLPGVALQLANAVPAAVAATLSGAFNGLMGRTGRLVYTTPSAGSSCEVRALPTAAKARLSAAADGSLFLQIGFKRSPLDASDVFPPFAPQAGVDTAVTIGNPFLIDLLSCLLEQLPNLSLPTTTPTTIGVPSILGFPPATIRTWSGITLTLGVLTLKGELSLAIIGPPGGGKSVTLNFKLNADVSGAPGVAGQVLLADVNFMLIIVFDLSNVAAITSLRLSAAPIINSCKVEPGPGLMAMLWVAAAGMFMLPGLRAITTWGPPTVFHMGSQLLKNTIEQVLSVARLLQSPAAIPAGVFEAFGKLVPASIRIDDTDARGVLDTPTSPWSLLPIGNLSPLPPLPAPIPKPPGSDRTPRSRRTSRATGRPKA
ncbi:MAG TPA: hypothetical protein VJ717_15835 [Gemmatimonadaceae bacterium]|nr:hypothetical protein [Gemmatimonadaceae bacterium]